MPPKFETIILQKINPLNDKKFNQMQNKGAIKLFAIALALVCLYQLSFTWITSGVKKDAEEYSKGNLALENRYLDSVASEGVYNVLWLRNYTYRECQERELNLGLDLKGGMNVMLEVSVVELIKALSNYSTDSTFTRSLSLAQQKQKNSQEDFVTLFGKSFTEVDKNAKLAAIFSTLDLKGRVNFNSTNEEVLKVIREETEDAIANSFNILRSRIDRFGVTQPNIQRLQNSGRILVELPGVKDPERVRKLLQGTANLQFWETYDNREIFQHIKDANDRIRQIENKNPVDTSAAKAKKDSVAKKDKSVAKNDKTDSTKKDTTKDVSLLDKVKKDTSKTGKDASNFEAFRTENPLFAVLRPSVSQDGQLVTGAAVGIAHFKDTAKVNEYLSRKQIRELFPRDLKFLWSVKPIDDRKSGNYYQLIAIKVSNRDGRPALSGDVITNARPEFSDQKGGAEVTMSMNGDGARIWARLTKENIGKQVAIVLDNYVYSFPTVQSEIRGGHSSITGNFSITEAKDLANILKSGKMPAPAHIIEEDIVGPSLGKEAISSSLISFIIAFAIVLIYMIFYYNKAGLIANIALIVNVFFIFGVLASLGAVLTLPGMAGIVLTLGMAVDANVLIYERILEEVKQGKGLKLAVSDGYKHAMSAIIDSNVTTILTGIVLYVFGSGPIQGFATTLIIGILTSLFTAIFFSRLIIEWMLERNKNVSFCSKMTENFLANTNVDFLGKRKFFYGISGIVILAGIISMFAHGFNLGVDFKGGRTYVVRFDQDIRTIDVQASLKTQFGDAPEVKTFGGDNQVKITTKYRIDENEPNIDTEIQQKLYDGLKSFYKTALTYSDFCTDNKAMGIVSSQKVGPTIADDIKTSAVWAITFALIIIFIYIFIRFKNWRFGLGGLVSLAHDVLFVLGMYSLLYSIMPFSMEIDQAFIAAILTIVGYSINDTVVVFDRVREYLGMGKKWDKKETYNRAMNSTLRRTLNTSLTTLLTIFAIFIFGGEVIRGFIFALLIGIGVGTYSSIFVATSIVYDTDKTMEKVEAKKLAASKTDKKA